MEPPTASHRRGLLSGYARAYRTGVVLDGEVAAAASVRAAGGEKHWSPFFWTVLGTFRHPWAASLPTNSAGKDRRQVHNHSTKEKAPPK